MINAAVGGYVAADNLKNLKHRVLPLNPDLVIYYEANNEIVKDTRDVAVRDGLISADGRRQPAWSHDAVEGQPDVRPGLQEPGDSRAQPRGRPPHRQGAARSAGALHRASSTRCAPCWPSGSIPLVLSTFIVKYRRDQDRATQIANADVAFFYMPWMSIDGLLDAMDVYNDAIVKYGSRAGLLVVDDRIAIPPDTEHFSDCMHLLRQGQ